MTSTKEETPVGLHPAGVVSNPSSKGIDMTIIADGTDRENPQKECPQYAWCVTEDQDYPGWHSGTLVTASSGGSSIDLWVDMDPEKTFFEFDTSWRIEYDDIDKEIADLRSIIDQFEAALHALRNNISAEVV